MAKALGYGKKITWETIQTPYYPEGLMQCIENTARFEQGQLAMADFMLNMTGNPGSLGNTMLTHNWIKKTVAPPECAVSIPLSSERPQNNALYVF